MNSDTIKTNTEIILNHFYTNFGLNWFEGKNIVFDDMKSSGKTSLIVSDSLRNKIQNYYRLFDEVIKQENLHNSFIIKSNESISASINISPFIEFGMPKRWNVNETQLTMNDFGKIFSNFREDQKTLLAEINELTPLFLEPGFGKWGKAYRDFKK